MKKYLFGAMMLAVMPVLAQETYENAQIATSDLNGTARYVGMGGALEALGADITTIGTNPAGIGLFRRSVGSVTAGVVSQADAAQSQFGDATNVSFDQIGFVWSTDLDENNYINVGFNYQKSRNFNYILSAADRLSGASQYKLSTAKGYEGCFQYDNLYNQVDYLYDNVLGLYDENEGWIYQNASYYDMNRANKGYVGEYDINISGSIDNRFYLGMTIGFCDIDYSGYSTYKESLLADDGSGIGSVILTDERHIEGSGINLKFGFIARPIEGSPFRIGAYLHTPTWYSLTTTNNTRMDNYLDKAYGNYDYGTTDEGYDYHVYTPWKAGLSLGHIVAGRLALGATAEVTDYSTMKSRVISGYNAYGDERSYNDDQMNAHTESTLKATTLLKFGAEYKLNPNWAVRAGYNYVSPMYDKDGYKDGTINSPGSFYASQTDFTNWKSTNRFTLGLGYAGKGWSFDLAYQYSQTNGDFSPFMSYYSNDNPDNDCVADFKGVSDKRHQVIATLSCKF